MIQGLHGSSIAFADFGVVSGGLLANLNRRLPGIEAAGYPVRLNGAEYRLRLGQLRLEKRYLEVHLDLESKFRPFQPQLAGTVRLENDPKQSRTKVMFEGRCARTFGSYSSAATTESVRRLANESTRTILELLVTAMEESSVGPADARGATSKRGRSAKDGNKPGAGKTSQVSKRR